MNKDSLTSTDVLERSFNVSRDFTLDLDLIRAAAETDPIFVAVWQRATKYAGCEEKEVCQLIFDMCAGNSVPRNRNPFRWKTSW